MLRSNFISDHIVSPVLFKIAARPANRLEADQYLLPNVSNRLYRSLVPIYLYTIHNVHSSSTYLADIYRKAMSERPPATHRSRSQQDFDEGRHRRHLIEVK